MKRVWVEYTSEVIGLLVIVVLFLTAGYFSQVYFDVLIDSLTDHYYLGMLLYVGGATMATVIAPLSFFPLLPVAAQMWGSFLAAVLSIMAWSMGAAIAFLLARQFGRPLVRHFVGDAKLDRFARLLPQKHLFIAVVILRFILPIDLLSYALGLVGVLRFWPYMAATIIGITPFTFIFSYTAMVPMEYQIGLFILIGIMVVVSLPYVRRRYRAVFQDEVGE